MTKLMSIESTTAEYGAPVRFLKSKFRTAMLVIFFLLSFSSLKYIPGLKILFLIWLWIVFLFLITIYPTTILAKQIRITRLELYSLLILFCVPLIAAYASNSEFGQPLLYGIGTNGQTVLVGGVMIFLYFYRSHKFSLADVERAFLWLAWINLFFIILFKNIFNANQFDDIAGFVGGMEGQKQFTLPSDFILIGFYYYAFSGHWKKNIRSSFVALLIFIFLALGGSRSGLISLVASYLFFMLRWGSFEKRVGNFLKVSALGFSLVVMLGIFLPDKFIQMQEKLGDAFTVLLKQEEVEDISANARNLEVIIALPYIEKHWLLGNGLISPSWNDGYKSLLGYFHPSDIGILGVLYMHGLVGLLLFSFQYYFAIRYSSRLPKNGGRHGRLVSALKGYLLFVAINSITTGKFAVFVEHSLLIIVILYCAAQAERMGYSERFMRGGK